MNPVIEAIVKRRSVRSYKPDPVPRDAIEAIIDAGNWAPTGLNQQCWRFVVVDATQALETVQLAVDDIANVLLGDHN